MAESNKKTISLSIIAFTALFCVAFFLARVWHLKRNGVAISYLAELWAPSSMLSIVIVTFLEKFTGQTGKVSKKPKK